MKLIVKAMTKAINFNVKKFLARKLIIILVIPPKSITEVGASVLVDLDEASFSAASIAANCFSPNTSVFPALL